MAVATDDRVEEFESDDIAYDVDTADVLAPSRNGDRIPPIMSEWVSGILLHGEPDAVREALSDSQDSERKALKKWIRADARYGTKLRALRAEYERARADTTALFGAATRGLG